MTAEEIRTVYYKKPFEPFVVRLTDGRKFRIAERYHIGISPTDDSITIASGTDEFVFAKISDVVSLDHPKTKQKKKHAKS